MISVAGSYLISTNPAIAKAIQQASVEDESQQQEASVYHFEGFNERVQAYIVARYYVRLKGAFGEQGLKVFQLATRTYAEQRGHRMAQQALADGQPLTIETYHRYGEWVSSDECRRKGEDLQQQVIWDAPYYTFHVTRCPWSIQFRDMGLQEAGIAYCKDLDASLLEEGDALLGRTSHTRHTEEAAYRRADEVGIIEVGQRVADDDGIYPSSISRAKNGSEVARLLYPFDNDYQRLFP